MKNVSVKVKDTLEQLIEFSKFFSLLPPAFFMKENEIILSHNSFWLQQ